MPTDHELRVRQEAESLLREVMMDKGAQLDALSKVQLARQVLSDVEAALERDIERPMVRSATVTPSPRHAWLDEMIEQKPEVGEFLELVRTGYSIDKIGATGDFTIGFVVKGHMTQKVSYTLVTEDTWRLAKEAMVAQDQPNTIPADLSWVSELIAKQVPFAVLLNGIRDGKPVAYRVMEGNGSDTMGLVNGAKAGDVPGWMDMGGRPVPIQVADEVDQVVHPLLALIRKYPFLDEIVQRLARGGNLKKIAATIGPEGIFRSKTVEAYYVDTDT